MVIASLMGKIDIFSEKIEKLYSNEVDYSHRKNYGQFFTPFTIANFMTYWILSPKKDMQILDPGIGTGIFERSIFKKYKNSGTQIDAYEIDKSILEITEKIKEEIHPLELRILNKDYLGSPWNRKYDAIICNPPYYKHHFIDNKKRVFNEFEKAIDFKLSLNTNIYCLFIIKSLQQLAYNGKMAYITPSEFLNSNYGERIKEYILQTGFLRYLIIFDFKLNVFSNTTTTACISLFANDVQNHTYIKIINVTQEKQIELLYGSIDNRPLGKKLPMRIYSPNDLDPKLKWRNYIKHSEDHSFLAPFTKYACVKRGIATGDNNFFILNKEQLHALNIGEKYVVPCITKASQAQDNIFTMKDFETLKTQGKKVYLLYLNRKELDDSVKIYLKHGKDTDVHKKYLTSHRTPWYATEEKPPAPIWVTVFSRKTMRFIKNEANVYNLTCFHGVYSTALGLKFKNVLMAYLTSDVCQRILQKEKREYGNGLEKFEPNDINKGKIIDFMKLSEDEIYRVEKLYADFRQATLSGQDDKALGFKSRINAAFEEILRKHATHNRNSQLQLQLF